MHAYEFSIDSLEYFSILTLSDEKRDKNKLHSNTYYTQIAYFKCYFQLFLKGQYLA